MLGSRSLRIRNENYLGLDVKDFLKFRASLLNFTNSKTSQQITTILKAVRSLINNKTALTGAEVIRRKLIITGWIKKVERCPSIVNKAIKDNSKDNISLCSLLILEV